MAQQQGIVKGDALQKIGSAGFIIGTALRVIGVLLMPPAVNPSNVQEMLNPLGEQVLLTQVSVLLMAAGVWTAMIGTAGVYRSITASGAAASGAAWARLGFYFVLVGTALWTVGMSLDASTASATANWLATPTDGKEAAYSVVAALSAFGRGLFPMEVIVNWLAFAFIGTGMVRSAVYPRWLGWVGLILGIAGVALGIMQTVTGRESSLNLFMVLAFLTTLWFLLIGIWVARKAW